MMNKADGNRIGLVDIGSNTIRLVVFYLDSANNLRELQNIKIPARIFQYLDADNVMSDEGIQVLCNVLTYFEEEAHIVNASTILYKATAAIRQATNREEILSKVKERTGIDIDVIPGEMEAYYGYYAITRTTSYNEAVTIDIGGGSAEVTHFVDKQLVNSFSFPFGVVTLQELFFTRTVHNDPKAIKKTIAYVQKQFAKQSWLKDLNIPIIAIGGSARNIANVHQRLHGYPLAGIHGYLMGKSDIMETLNVFKSRSMDELYNLDGLSSERTDIIIPANIVFTELMAVVGGDQFIFSNRGLREGMIMDYLSLQRPDLFSKENVADQTIERFGRLYSPKMATNAQRMFIVDLLLKEFKAAGLLNIDDNWHRLVRYGGYLYSIGDFIEMDSSSQHTFYIVSNSNLLGLTHKEKVIVALIASYKNRSLFNQYTADFATWFSGSELSMIQKLGGVTKFADSLNGSHVNIVHSLNLVKDKESGYIMRITNQGDAVIEVLRAERQKKHLERITHSPIRLEFTKI